MGLVGKFFMHFGKEFCQTGQVVEQVTPDTLLVRTDHCCHAVAAVMLVIKFSDMITKYDDEGIPEKEWQFFDTRDDLQAFVDWLDKPDEPKVAISALN